MTDTFELKKFHHESGQGIYALSKKVSPRDHIQLALDMAAWLTETNGKFSGNFSSGYAIAHCQIAEEPIALFVVAPQLVGTKEDKHTQKNYFFPSAAIFNAELLEAPEEIVEKVPNRVLRKNPDTKQEEMTVELMERKISNKVPLKEACMSWPNRTEKNVERFFRIKVRYQYLKKVLGVYVPMRRTEWVEGLKAHIFQHELDHFAGKNIYFK